MVNKVEVYESTKKSFFRVNDRRTEKGVGSEN